MKHECDKVVPRKLTVLIRLDAICRIMAFGVSVLCALSTTIHLRRIWLDMLLLEE
jgi:hypothetical protein